MLSLLHGGRMHIFLQLGVSDVDGGLFKGGKQVCLSFSQQFQLCKAVLFYLQLFGHANICLFLAEVPVGSTIHPLHVTTVGYLEATANWTFVFNFLLY